MRTSFVLVLAAAVAAVALALRSQALPATDWQAQVAAAVGSLIHQALILAALPPMRLALALLVAAALELPM